MSSIDASGTAPEASALLNLLTTGDAAGVAESARRIAARADAGGALRKLAGTCLLAAGCPAEARVALVSAMDLLPLDAEVRYDLGIALTRLARHEEACMALQDALRLDAALVDAHAALGLCLLALGHSGAAQQCAANALALAPNHAPSLRLLGALTSAGTAAGPSLPGVAVPFTPILCREAAADWPVAPADMDFEATLQAAFGLRALGREEEFRDALRGAAALCPDQPMARGRVGISLAQAGCIDDGEKQLRQALALEPDNPALLNNLGALLSSKGDSDAAADCYRRSLEIRPGHAATLHNHAGAMLRLGRTEEAIAGYRQTLERDPGNADARSDFLFCLSRVCTDARELFAEHRRYGTIVETPLRANWTGHANPRDPERTLRIGFVSGDFRNHSVAYFIEPALRRLAASRGTALYGYANSNHRDATTHRLQETFTGWRAVTGLSDRELARQIMADGIDILIDLSGHTAGNRLPVFARKPAPLQASWIGYPGTTGLSAVDYYIGDEHLLPVGMFDSGFTEAILRLPAIACFQPDASAPPPNPLPAQCGGIFTFGSFNHSNKISRTTLALWSHVLRAVPGSHLRVCGVETRSLADEIHASLEEEGVPRERIAIRGRLDMPDYLAEHHRVDLCLDSFPYNGGTTTLHALWMGVPTLTLAGNVPASRAGATQLRTAGLSDFVAESAAQFVELGQHWAGNTDRLARIRLDLRARLANSPLCRSDFVADAFGHALRVMWRRWCAGLPPVAFTVHAEDLPGI